MDRKKMLLRLDDLENNPTARVAVCLVLDTSYSMNGEPLKELNEGVRTFFDAIKNDEIACEAAEICVVAFGGEEATKVLDFESIKRQQCPTLRVNGRTPMGDGVNLALRLLEQRKREYSNAGVDYYQPWMVLMTDGEPTDDIREAAQRTAQLIQEKKLVMFPIAIGENANQQTLMEFSPKRRPLQLKGLNFSQFFDWLSKSVARVSQSTPGEKVPLDTSAINDWAEL